MARVALMLSTSGSLTELKRRCLDEARGLFGDGAAAIGFTDPRTGTLSLESVGIPPRLLRWYERRGGGADPLLRLLHQRHAPLHQRQLFRDVEWMRLPAVRLAARILGDFPHYLLGPIVHGGRIVGTLHVSRPFSRGAFGEGDMAKLSALCTHASVTLAGLGEFPTAAFDLLRPREAEMARLVAQGFTNTMIAAALGISENTVKTVLKSVFRRLDVESRAALVARLGLRFS